MSKTSSASLTVASLTVATRQKLADTMLPQQRAFAFAIHPRMSKTLAQGINAVTDDINALIHSMRYAINDEVRLAMDQRDHLIEQAIDRLVCHGVELDQMCLVREPNAVDVLTVNGARVWRVKFLTDFSRDDERYFVVIDEEWLADGLQFVPEMLSIKQDDDTSPRPQQAKGKP